MTVKNRTLGPLPPPPPRSAMSRSVARASATTAAESVARKTVLAPAAAAHGSIALRYADSGSQARHVRAACGACREDCQRTCQRRQWTCHGTCREYVSVDVSWDVSGGRVGRNSQRTCRVGVPVEGRVRRTCRCRVRKCLGNVSLRSVSEVSRKCLESVSEMSRKCLGSVSEVYRKCLGSVSEMSRGSRKCLRPPRRRTSRRAARANQSPSRPPKLDSAQMQLDHYFADHRLARLR